MASHRLTQLAQADISGILIRSHASFGEAAEVRYAALIAAAIRDAAERSTGIGFTSPPNSAMACSPGISHRVVAVPERATFVAHDTSNPDRW